MGRIRVVYCVTASLVWLTNVGFSQKDFITSASDYECRVFEHSIKCKKYIEKYYTQAVKEMLIYGVPASIILAQGMLESANGESELAVSTNNHFGIKCHETWTGLTFNHDDDLENECFRKYSSVFESYSDHSKFLRFRSRYAFLFDLKVTDYVAWARGLKQAGYATDPNYADRLINIIRQNSLHMYDSIACLLNVTSMYSNYTTATNNLFKKIEPDTIKNIPEKPAVTVFEKPTGKKNFYVELTGKVKERDEEGKYAAVVTVYKDSAVYYTCKPSRSGKCTIRLPLNQQYTLVFSEPGYVSKKIKINTQVKTESDTIYKFQYTVYLFEEIKGLDISLLNQPVAFVSLNEFNQFDYDYWNTIAVNRKVEEIYYNYYLLAGK